MQTTTTTTNVSAHRTTLVAREGRPQQCANCDQTCHDLIRVHCVRTVGTTVTFALPCYWVCNDNCARTIARRDIDGMTFR